MGRHCGSTYVEKRLETRIASFLRNIHGSDHVPLFTLIKRGECYYPLLLTVLETTLEGEVSTTSREGCWNLTHSDKNKTAKEKNDSRIR